MIIGHQRQLKFLEEILQSKKVPQSYFFVGPEGVGKFTIAKLFAESLITGKQKIDCEHLQNQSKENNNQDIEILTPEIVEKKGITRVKNFETKTVRQAQKNLFLFPAMGKYRVLIIDEAQLLNEISQNSLLKFLEEPNKTAIIILVAKQEEKILGTIKSRCQRIGFNLVGLDEIGKFLEKANVATPLKKEITLYSMGRPSEAVTLLKEQNLLKERKQNIIELKKMMTMNVTEKIFLAEQYSKNLPKTLKKIELWIWFLRVRAFGEMQDERKLRKYYQVITDLEKSLRKLENNSFNSRIILENLFLNL